MINRVLTPSTFATLGSSKIRNAAVAIAFGLAIAGSALPASANVINLRANARAAGGWQAPAALNIPQGQTSEFIHYGCPTGAPFVDNGAYAFNEPGQVTQSTLGFNGPRLDENPAYFGEWGWEFSWPSGAPAGLTVTVDIHCVLKK